MGRAVADTRLVTQSKIEELEFIEQYVDCLDPKQAVVQALSINNPDFLMLEAEEDDIKQLATVLLNRIPVQEAINARLVEAVQRQRMVTSQWVLDQATVVYNKCMQVDSVKDKDGDAVIGQFNPVAALRALELVGKHVDIQAFKEVIELETGPNLAQSLDAARKRSEQRATTLEQEAEDGETSQPLAIEGGTHGG